jgi:hypothetical protein
LANSTLSAHRDRATPAKFNLALAALRSASRRVSTRPSRSSRATYSRSIDRLLALPAPNVFGLAAKMEAIDPFDLDQFAVVLNDARRLAGL